MQEMESMQNSTEMKYIDKTKNLEEGIGRFPSVYIEGNAAVGKSVAVKMLLEKHPKVQKSLFDLNLELKDQENFCKQLKQLVCRMKTEERWVVFENMPQILGQEVIRCLQDMLHQMKAGSRIIFVSRHKPQLELLQFLWKNEMGLIPMKTFLFSQEELRSFLKQQTVSLDARKVHKKTGGWPGCAAVLAHLAEGAKHQELEVLLESYEIRKYVQCEILGGLEAEERELLAKIAGCPWVSEALLTEVWGVKTAREHLENLERKGMLTYEEGKKRWKIMPLFEHYVEERLPVTGEEHAWYEKQGFIEETFACLKKSGEQEIYQNYLWKYFSEVYAKGLVSEELLKRKENTPVDCYLRGVYYYANQQFKELQSEIETIRRIKEKDFQTKEILLNLSYLNPQVPLEQWLKLLENSMEIGKKFRMYHMLGNSVTYLCGVRDLSGMFACTTKEEKHRAHLWKEAFGEAEWKGYQLARMDYYLETERKESIPEEDWNLMRIKDLSLDSWQVRLVKLYLLCKIQRMEFDERYNDRIQNLEKSLKEENRALCTRMTECISSLYAPWYGEKDKMSRWLRYAAMDSTVAITEENYVMLYCQAKGYLLLSQYERAEKILKKLIPYLQAYRRGRFLTEMLFQYAVINWAKNLKGKAVQNVIESFLHCGNCRYVVFYSGYGKKGQEVLEAYVEWHKGSVPERWSQKKKYKYGNVLRMTPEDYYDVVVRNAKKVCKNEKKFSEEYIEEHLTLTEALVLQDIGRGLTNQQICDELGVKMPTVKGHIYNLYKKLGVKTRGQAIVKGRELGILK